MSTLLTLNNQMISLSSQVSSLINGTNLVVNTSVNNQIGSTTLSSYPTSTTAEWVKYDNSTITSNLNTVVDPMVVSRRTNQINSVNAQTVALQQQSLVQSTLSALAAAQGLPLGANAGRYMGRFAVQGQPVISTGDDSFQILDMDVAYSGNIYVLCTSWLNNTYAYMYNLNGTISANYILSNSSYVANGYYVYIVKYNSRDCAMGE